MAIAVLSLHTIFDLLRSTIREALISLTEIYKMLLGPACYALRFDNKLKPCRSFSVHFVFKVNTLVTESEFSQLH
jgi:hypothetical protein